MRAGWRSVHVAIRLANCLRDRDVPDTGGPCKGEVSEGYMTEISLGPDVRDGSGEGLRGSMSERVSCRKSHPDNSLRCQVPPYLPQPKAFLLPSISMPTSENQPASTMSADKDEDHVLAEAPGECCLKGNIHEGESRGKLVTVASIETYLSEPTRPNGHILLYFPDVWGLFPNGLLIMDGFADAGYLVLGLDYFRGVSPYFALFSLRSAPESKGEKKEVLIMRGSVGPRLEVP